MRPTTPANQWTIKKELNQDVGELTRATALALDRGIVRNTPVDTGRARSNWIVQINSRSTAVDPHEFGTTEAPKGWTAALNQGAQEIMTAPDYCEIHITNNLPYIGALNNGHSKQARPAMYIERQIDRVARNQAKHDSK